MPCAPLGEAEDLRGAYDAYARSGREIPLLAVVSFPYPVERALALDSEGVLRPKYPDSWHARSQDLAPAYHDAGLFSFSPAAHIMNPALVVADRLLPRSEAHTSELQSLMRISYAGFCLKNKH